MNRSCSIVQRIMVTVTHQRIRKSIGQYACFSVFWLRNENFNKAQESVRKDSYKKTNNSLDFIFNFIFNFDFNFPPGTSKSFSPTLQWRLQINILYLTP